MNNRIPATKLQQQSYIPDWLLNADIPIPPGLVVSCQMTTTSNSPIILQELSYANGVLQLVFQQDGLMCASGMFTADRKIQPMTTTNGVLSATIETGVIPNGVEKYTNINAQLSPSYIRVVADTRSIAGQKKLVTIQDGVSTVVNVDRDIHIKTSSNLRCSMNSESTIMTIAMDDSDHMDYIKLGNGVIKPGSSINTINGVRPTITGNVVINIYNAGKLIPVTEMGDNWVAIDGSNIPFCPEPVDLIDSYISPTTHTGYLPLDDLYTKSTDASNVIPIRDTEFAETLRYGRFNENPGVKLMEIDPNVDESEQDIQA